MPTSPPSPAFLFLGDLPVSGESRGFRSIFPSSSEGRSAFEHPPSLPPPFLSIAVPPGAAVAVAVAVELTEVGALGAALAVALAVAIVAEASAAVTVVAVVVVLLLPLSLSLPSPLPLPTHGGHDAVCATPAVIIGEGEGVGRGDAGGRGEGVEAGELEALAGAVGSIMRPFSLSRSSLATIVACPAPCSSYSERTESLISACHSFRRVRIGAGEKITERGGGGERGMVGLMKQCKSVVLIVCGGGGPVIRY